MKTNSTPIFFHDEEHYIAHKGNAKELEIWFEHLLYIHKEIKFLEELCQRFISLAHANSLKIELNRRLVENEKILRKLEKYNQSRSKIKECEDMECDRLFIYEHENCRISYQRYVRLYRKVKEGIFNLIAFT